MSQHLISMFSEQVKSKPNQKAIIQGDRFLSFNELDKKSDIIAYWLLKESVSEKVGISISNSIETIIAIIGTLKAGAAYVPIDPQLPKMRKQKIIDECSIDTILESGGRVADSEISINIGSILEQYENVNVQGIVERDCSDKSLAYVIYTSGSSGTPKGVMIERGSLINLAENINREILSQYPQTLNIALISPYYFDGSIKMIFSSLLFGHTLHIIQENKRFDGYELLRFFIDSHIHVTDGTPVHLKLLNEVKDNFLYCDLKHMLIGGESLNTEVINRLIDKLPHVNITNVYGPTECCVDSTMYHIPKTNLDVSPTIPIGKPLANVNVFLLNENNEVVGDHSIGEICISGVNLARGYVNARENFGKFILDPEIYSERFYRTGDLASFNERNELVFKGRVDNQVKIDGNRIELDEIKQIILKMGVINEAVINIYTHNANMYICLYYTSDEQVDNNEIKDHLSRFVPKYMVPSFMFKMDNIPVTRNGKINEKELPKPFTEQSKLNAAPTNLYDQVRTIYEEVLSINIQDNKDFFELGGNSLTAMLLINEIQNKLNCKLKVMDIFDKPDIMDLTQYIASKKVPQKTKEDNIQPTRDYRLLQSQIGLLNNQLVDKDNLSNNITLAIKFKHELDKNKLTYTLKELINRHSALRQVVPKSDQPYVKFLAYIDELNIEELPLHSSDSIDESIKSFIRPFNMNGTALYRIGLRRINPEEWLLIWDFHHLLLDGISLNILYKELLEIYTQDSSLDPLNVQWDDYIVHWPKKDNTHAKRYWMEIYERKHIPLINLETDYKREEVKTFNGAVLSVQLDKDRALNLSEISKKTKSTKAILLYTAYLIMLHKVTGQDKVQIGFTFSGRDETQYKDMVGMLVKMLPISNTLNPESGLDEIIELSKENILNAISHSEYPYEQLVKDLETFTPPNRNPLFDVSFTYNKSNPTNDNSIERVFLATDTSKNDLALEITEDRTGISLNFRYNTTLFKDSTIQNFRDAFLIILEQILLNPNAPLDSIEFLDQYQLVSSYSDVKPKRTLIHEFKEIARKYPDHLAVDFQMEKLTYQELNKRSDILANELISKGIGIGDRVAIHMDPSENVIIAILGILKSGSSYVPIDTSYPSERIEYMIKNSDCKAVIIDDKKVASVKVETINLLSLDWGKATSCIYPDVKPDDTAYIIYTSGSTGKPKGVKVSHANVTSLIKGNGKLFSFDESDKWLLFHSTSFDFSVWEIFGSLLNGSTLIVLTKMDVKDPNRVSKIIDEKKVTVLNQTPTAFNNLKQLLMTKHEKHSLKTVIFGGEQLYYSGLYEFVEKYPQTDLINMYGITETTVHVTYKKITLQDVHKNKSNIGIPLESSRVLLLDEERKLVPKGAIGEMYIGGDGVSKGYCNLDQLNKSVFVQNPYDRDELLYKSGDLAKENENGELEYIGRKDNQIKVNGYRIEKGEIEETILNISNVKECRVEIYNEPDNKKSMFAFLMGISMDEGRELISNLRSRLPHFMIPHKFFLSTEFPVNNNGKIDILQAIKNSRTIDTAVKPVLPENNVEMEMAEIWAAILDTDCEDTNQNYFFIGGDSIKAVETISKINRHFNVDLEIKDIYLYSTIKKLADLVQTVRNEIGYRSKQIDEVKVLPIELEKDASDLLSAFEVEDVFLLSDIQYGMLYYSIKYPDESFYHDQMLYDILDKEFDLKCFKDALCEMVNKHEILRTNFIMEQYSLPLQVVKRFNKDHVQIKHIEISSDKSEIDRELSRDRDERFDLEDGPLWRMNILERTTDNTFTLLFTAHHAILDGWSVASFITELNETYVSLKNNTYFRTTMKNSYKSYVESELKKKANSAVQDYWKSELADFEKENILPDNQNLKNINLKTITREVDSVTMEKIKRVARENGCSVKAVFLAGFIAMSNMMSKNQDILVGIVDHDRPIVEDSSKILGCFLNTLPIRIKIKNSYTWKELITGVHQKLIDTKKHSTTLNQILKDGEITEGNSTSPLFDLLFNFVDFHVYNQTENLLFRPKSGGFARTNSKFDLTVSLTLNEVKIKVFSEFSKELTHKMISYYTSILEKIYEDTEATINKEQIHGEQVELVQSQLNNEPFSVLEKINEVATDHPNLPALINDREILTYTELMQKSDSAASFLCESGIRKGDIVALEAYKDIKTVLLILGIYKLGAVYVPINEELPQNRKEFILEDSQAKIFLTMNTDVRSDVDLINLNEIDLNKFKHRNENYGNVEEPDQVKYIIYTSGTTGNPKGIKITYGQMSHYFQYSIFSRIEKRLNTVLSSSFMFDASIEEIFGSFVFGHTLNVISNDILFEPEQLVHYFAKNKINIFVCTPSHLKLFNFVDDFKGLSLKYLVLAGEPLQKELVVEFLRKFSVNDYFPVFINNYGPSEICIDATDYIVKMEDLFPNNPKSISIGKPFGKTRLYILDSNKQQQPSGVPGDVYIGGPGAVRGYLNESNNNKSYSLNPFGHSEFMYDTGDIGVKDEEGNYYFIARRDSQVKINGQRIELGEVEHAIKATHLAKDVYVSVKENANKDKVLCAYVIWQESELKQKLREELQKNLASYMLPDFIITLKEFPLNKNGKIDSRALPDPFMMSKSIVDNESWTELQKSLAAIWRTVLGIDSVNLKSDFFDMGGRSIKAVELVHKIRTAYNIELKMNDLFENTTIEKLAKAIGHYQHNIKSSTHIDPVSTAITYFNNKADIIERVKAINFNLCAYFRQAPTQEEYDIGCIMSNISHKNETNGIFGTFKVEFNFKSNQLSDEIDSIIQNLMDTQDIFRTVPFKVNDSYRFKVKAPVLHDKNSFVIDLCEFDDESKQFIIKEVTSSLASLLYKREYLENIMYGLIVFKVQPNEYKFLMISDHQIADVNSSNIIKSYFMVKRESAKNVPPFSEYVQKVLCHNNKGKYAVLNESDIYKSYVHASRFINKKLNRRTLTEPVIVSSPTKISIEINHRIMEAFNYNVLSIFLNMIVELLFEEFGVEEVPIRVQYNWRKFNGNDYSHTLGNFSDGLPCTFTRDKSNHLEQYDEVLRFMTENMIRFRELNDELNTSEEFYHLSPFSVNFLGDIDHDAFTITNSSQKFPFPMIGYTVDGQKLYILFSNGLSEETKLKFIEGLSDYDVNIEINNQKIEVVSN